jgi:ABC-2 type transport system ATP-binding protein
MFLSFDRVTKFYGPVIGVNDVSCRIGPGITGLLGANGAGKSTLIKLASGQLRPNLGRVSIGDHDAWSTASRRHFGYCPDINTFYEEMTGREFVRAMASLYGYSRAETNRRSEEALAEVGLSDVADKRLAGCSHGMRQRIKLAQALLHDPTILLLDEPLTGIDPGGRRAVNQLLLDLAARGKTILVSTHILVEIEHLADTILVIARGRLVASGTLAQMRSLMDDCPLTVEIAADRPRRLAGLLFELPEVSSIEVGDESLRVRTRTPARFFGVLGALVLAEGIEIRRLQTLDAGADAVFGYLAQGRP